jgi:ketosteroid isomerase-like protein
MKQLIFFSLMLIVNNPIYSQQEKLNTMESEVLKVITAFNKAFANNNVDEYFEFIHDDLTLFIAASPYRIDGKKVDKEEFVWSLKKERTKVSFFQELQAKVQILSPTSALVTYHNRGAYGPDEKEQIAYLKESDVLVLENEKWKIIHIHVSK